jgi:hypothetical protein
MTIQRRLSIMIVLLVIAAVLYGTARFYAPSLVFYVVEQTLLQKAPQGTDPDSLHERLDALVSAASNREAGMERLFRISEYLEKVQSLTSEQLDELLQKG